VAVSKAATCLQTKGEVPCGSVSSNPAACYFNFVLLQGRLLNCHMSPDLGGLMCSRVFLDLATCYFNSILQQGRIPSLHTSLDPGWALVRLRVHGPDDLLLICLRPPVGLAPEPPHDKADWVTEDDDGHTEVVRSPSNPHYTCTVAHHLTMYT
jgi:hypothetical protein